jgi:alpha-1,6-mannosyltransferase
MVHERLDALLSLWLPGGRLPRRVADHWNRRLVAAFDTVVSSTEWSRIEFDRIDAPRVVTVPLGVDLQLFHPVRRSAALRRALAPDGSALIALCSCLSPEKEPELAIDTLRTLRRRGRDVRLVVAGDGPLMARCRRVAADLPVTFLGFVADRARLAELMASVDVLLSLGPVETFGLSALESLASGTPVVGRRAGALPELLRDGVGAVAYGHPGAFATAVAGLLDSDADASRQAARDRACMFGWQRTIDRMLDVHGLPVLQRA